MAGHIVEFPKELSFSQRLSNSAPWNYTPQEGMAKVISEVGQPKRSGNRFVFQTPLTPTQVELLRDSGASVVVDKIYKLIKPIENQRDLKGIAPKKNVSAIRPLNANSILAHGADKLHAQGITGKGVRVFIADTGLYKHDDIPGSRVADFNDHTKDGEETKEDRDDKQGHGTHVAGTAVGNKGIAPGAWVHSEKVLGDNGSGQLSWILAGIDKAIEFKKANPDAPVVLSMSLGGPAQSADPNDDPMVKKMQEARALGIVVVLAAGNSGPNEGTVGSPAFAGSKKAGSVAIAVAAFDLKGTPKQYGDDGLANFSSRGALNPNAPKGQGDVPNVGASGVNVTSAKAGTTNEYATFSGTSMATPAVAGGVALLMEYAKKNGLDVAQLAKDNAFAKVLYWSAMGAKDAAALAGLKELLGAQVYNELVTQANSGVGAGLGKDEGAGSMRLDLAAKLLSRWYGTNKKADAPSSLRPPWASEGNDPNTSSPPDSGSSIPGLPPGLPGWNRLSGAKKGSPSNLNY